LLLDFFFQAEDGIRDGHVTGVQTCALPISWLPTSPRSRWDSSSPVARSGLWDAAEPPWSRSTAADGSAPQWRTSSPPQAWAASRSEERRVGKEGRGRWGADGEKEKRGWRD